MWSDDPWAREHADYAHHLAGVALAHHLDDLARRTRALGVSLDPHSALAFWQSVAASRAHAEIEDLTSRVTALCTRVWSAIT